MLPVTITVRTGSNARIGNLKGPAKFVYVTAKIASSEKLLVVGLGSTYMKWHIQNFRLPL